MTKKEKGSSQLKPERLSESPAHRSRTITHRHTKITHRHTKCLNPSVGICVRRVPGVRTVASSPRGFREPAEPLAEPSAHHNITTGPTGFHTINTNHLGGVMLFLACSVFTEKLVICFCQCGERAGGRSCSGSAGPLTLMSRADWAVPALHSHVNSSGKTSLLPNCMEVVAFLGFKPSKGFLQNANVARSVRRRRWIRCLRCLRCQQHSLVSVVSYWESFCSS